MKNKKNENKFKTRKFKNLQSSLEKEYQILMKNRKSQKKFALY